MRLAILVVVVASASAVDLRAGCHDYASCQQFVEDVYDAAAHWGVNRNVLSDALRTLVDARPANAWGLSDIDKQWCPNNSYYDFLPVHVATLMPNGAAVSWNASCFQDTSARITMLPGNVGANVTFSTSLPSGLLCDDVYLLVNNFKMRALDVSVINSARIVSVPTFEPNEWVDIHANGWKVLVLPCGIVGTIISAINTVELFIGSNLLQVNGDFLVQRNVLPPLQPFNKVTTVNDSSIRSGDYLAIARFDGLDPMVMWGTGGRTGHSAVAVWDQGVLYVVESTDANPFGAVYWPPPYGIIRTKFDHWVQLAQNASFMVSVLPLSPEWSAKFDETAFWTWFSTVEGQPYGYHTFMYCFLDTARPMANLPEPIDEPVFSWVITGLDRLMGNSSVVSMYQIFTDGMNQRLGTKCLDLACVSLHLTSLNQTFADVTAVPEMDAWRYEGGNTSMTCSMFAFQVWKNGFGNVQPWGGSQGNEQTPKDNYQMAIFDPAHFTDANCPGGVFSSAKGTYCQLMGPYVMDLNDYNSVPIYAGMNNHCPSQWPNYERCPASNPQCC